VPDLFLAATLEVPLRDPSEDGGCTDEVLTRYRPNNRRSTSEQSLPWNVCPLKQGSLDSSMAASDAP
jgi:hypothetical protein